MMNGKKLHVLLADDHLVVRIGLSALIDKQTDMSVIGEATDGTEAIELAEKLTPDVIVMDIMMPGTGGAEATIRIKREHPDVKILILTTFGSSPDVRRALNAGASGALSKDALQEELLNAIRRVADGECVIDKEIKSSLAAIPSVSTLSARQIEVLRLVAKGFDNKEIARLLELSVDGVKKHLKVIFASLGAASRTEAVSIALNDGLLKM